MGFDFHWSEEKVWALDLPIEEVPIADLEWHFDIPFWGGYSLKPIDVYKSPSQFEKEYDRTMKSDLSYPLDIMFWKERWLLLDGLHRLLKAKILGKPSVKVRKVPVFLIPQILK